MLVTEGGQEAEHDKQFHSIPDMGFILMFWDTEAKREQNSDDGLLKEKCLQTNVVFRQATVLRKMYLLPL